VAQDVADTGQYLHHNAVDAAKSGDLSSGRSDSGKQCPGVLGNGQESTESYRHAGAQISGPTNTRDTTTPLSTGDGAQAQRAFTSSEGPRTTTGPRSGTGVANQAQEIPVI
jgi:hypothetical protein